MQPKTGHDHQSVLNTNVAKSILCARAMTD